MIARNGKAEAATIKAEKPEIVHYSKATESVHTGPITAFDAVEYPDDEPLCKE